METTLNRAQSVQKRLSSMLARLDSAEQHAKTRDFPYKHLSDDVRLYVQNVSVTIREMVRSAATHSLISINSIQAPINEFHAARLTRHFLNVAKTQESTAEAVADATFATCECLVRTAAQLIAHLEACVEGDQSMDGRTIRRSPLWDK